MLNLYFPNKSVGILGSQSVVARVFIKQVLSYLHPTASLFILETPKDTINRKKLIDDPYFDSKEQAFLRTRVAYVSLADAPSRIESLDILLNLFLTVDFSQTQKIEDYHVLQSLSITNVLKKMKIRTTVLLSSIYSQEPGPVSEDEYVNHISIKNSFSDKATLKNFMADTFSNEIDAWRWSIQFMENCYHNVSSRVDIVRVPMVGPTLSDNIGYINKFNLFTYLCYQMGTGMIKRVNGRKENRVDVIPADFVASYIFMMAHYNSISPPMQNSDQPQKKVNCLTHNISSCSRNPLSLGRFISQNSEVWGSMEKKSVSVSISEKGYERKVNEVGAVLPTALKGRLGRFLDVPSWRIESQKEMIEVKRNLKNKRKYEYFFDHEWICASNNSIDLYQQLSPEEQARFQFNVNSINWKIYLALCCFGVKKHLLQQEVESFQPATLDMLSRKGSYFSDILWAFSEGKPVNANRGVEYTQRVLASKAVREALKALVNERMTKLENTPISYEKVEEQMQKVGEQICLQMFSDYSMGSIRMFAWFLHKVFRTIYEKVVIDKSSMMKLKNHNEQANGPLVVIPTHRSYIDFLIMSYVFFGYGIKCPHIAAAEDFLSMAVVHLLLRKSGAFFIKRNQQKHKQLYKAIMTEYVSQLLGDKHYLEFFIEGTRSRVGKMLGPKLGMLGMVVRNVIDGKIPDAHILPVTINYEKVLQGTSFTYEMMGEAKIKETLSRLLKAADVLKQNFGRIYIEVCDSISVKQFLAARPSLKPEQSLMQLGNEIVSTLSNNVVITTAAVVATTVLMHRRGVSDDSLNTKVNWLSQQIASRGIKVGRSQSDSSISIGSTLVLLSDILIKSKKDMFEVQLSFDQNSFVKLFKLVYYRNTLAHIFFEEAIVLAALATFGYTNIITTKINLADIYKQSAFLAQLLKNQFYLQHLLESPERFTWVVNMLVRKKVLKQEGGLVSAATSGEHMNMCCSFVWPVVESYWITLLYLFKLKEKNMLLSKFLREIQWFAQSLISEHIISHVEAISSDTIKNAVSIFTSMGLLKQDGANIQVLASEQDLRQLEQRIGMFLKSTYAKSLKGIFDSGQGSMTLDFPFLSKL